MTSYDYDLLIIGTGSGNSIITPDFDTWNIGIIERGVFGGTCLNRGCIPSKMLVHIADSIEQIRQSERLGIVGEVKEILWSDILLRVYGRIDPISQSGEAYREGLPHVTVHKGHARFTGPNSVEVNGDQVSAQQIVIATGAKPYIPEIPGLSSIRYHTSDSIMRMEKIPDRLTIIGGGYIATEMAHVFDALGAEVVLIARADRLLRDEDTDISDRFTEAFKERIAIHLNSHIGSIEQTSSGETTLHCQSEGTPFTISTQELLVATGRIPTASELNTPEAKLTLENGYIVTDKFMRTNISHIWALGDVTNSHQLKHTANAEARVVSHNLANPDEMITVDLDPIPHAVFTNPQIAAVGATEQYLQETGQEYVSEIVNFSEVAYGWALEDDVGFCKVLVDPNTSLLLGAHILGPQASILIHQLIQGMSFKQTVQQLSRGMLYVHPALNEVVENALLKVSAACTNF